MKKDETIKNKPDDYKLKPAKLGLIKPEGWLKDQLLVQKNGLTGHIEEIWSDLGPDSGWLGGKGESWERGPYYLDGLIPLAWALNDPELKVKASKWIEWMLASQEESGFFGPKTNNDWWPRIVALKALMQHHQATDDPRILPFMDRYFRYQLKALPEAPFQMWGASRALEELVIIYYAYQHMEQPYLLELAQMIGSQCYAWEELFADFPYQKTTHAYLNKHLFKIVKRMTLIRQWLKKKLKIPANLHQKSKSRIQKENNSRSLMLFHQTHSVNLAMALKMPALKGLFCNSPGMACASRAGLLSLLKYHGQANGLFSGDEHLNGKSPASGAELCLAVEYLYSLSQLFAITGEAFYGDLIERIAYNALPATFTEDMCAHQYVQQVNQVEVSRKKRDWYDAYSESNLFGLEPNFGCCTANMHQGWPKLLNNMFFTDGGIVTVGIYAPCKAALHIKETPVVIAEDTGYPFKETISFLVETIGNDEQRLGFSLRFRLPEWAESYSLAFNGKEIAAKINNHFIEMEAVFEAGDVITLELPMKVEIKQEEPEGVSLHRGPLMFALPIDVKRRVLRGQPPFADYELLPQSRWEFAVVPDMLDRAEVHQYPVSTIPYSDNDYPVTISIPMAPAPHWRMKHNSAGPVPQPFEVEPEALKNMVLVPYGCTRLRVAQFPAAYLK